MNEELSPQAQAAVDRVAKLMAVARDKAATEGEIQNALDLAHRILEQHGLDMALVERKSGESTGAKRKDKSSGGGLYRWQREVWEETAKLNMCRYFSIKGLNKGDKYENRVVGRPENVLMTELMAQYLQDTIERMAAEWAKDRGYQSRFVREAIIYREGMAETIGHRLRALHRERVAESKRKEEEARASRPQGEPGTGLVLASVIQSEEDLNTDYLLYKEPGTTARERAENERRWAEYRAAEEAKRIEHERRYAEDDEYAAIHDALQAAELLARQKSERAEAKRASKRKIPVGYRPENAQDRRRSHSAFFAGSDAGEKISLNTQVAGSSSAGRLK